jgi:hypothetical protein
MRTIRIVSDGVLIEVYDTIKESLEDATQYLKDLMKNDKVVTLIGENSSAILRPSSISAINIFDVIEDTPSGAENMKQPIKNQEQNTDEICDI